MGSSRKAGLADFWLPPFQLARARACSSACEAVFEAVHVVEVDAGQSRVASDHEIQAVVPKCLRRFGKLRSPGTLALPFALVLVQVGLEIASKERFIFFLWQTSHEFTSRVDQPQHSIELLLLRFNNFGYARGRVVQLGICALHQIADGVDHFVEKRLSWPSRRP